MTIKEIAELCGVNETTVQRWINKDGFLNCKTQLRNGDDFLKGNFTLRNRIKEKLDQGSPECPSDYDLEETLAIIGEGGGNKTLAALLAENAAYKDKPVAFNQPPGTEFAGVMDRLSAILEQNQRLMAENQKALRDPKTLAYQELEKFVQKHLEVDERRIHRVHIPSLWRAYEKEAKYPLGEREFMHKIALDHPEFELKWSRGEWVFSRCWTKRMI